MSNSVPDEQEVFPPREFPLEGDFFSYIAVLTQRAPQTLVFRTGSGRIFRDLLLHWPALEEWEDEAQDFCQSITDTVYPLTAALYAQAVEMTVVISSMPIEPPNHIDGMSTYIVFDLKARIQRHLFLSPKKPLPEKELMWIPRGIAIFCRPLHYRYHTIKDDRKRSAHIHAGIFQLTERLINELYGLPNFDLPARDVMEQLKTKANALRMKVVRSEEARLAKIAKENDLLFVKPVIVSVTSLSALPPEFRAFEGTLLRHVTDKTLPQNFRLSLRKIAQYIRMSNPPAMIEEAARVETTPPAAKTPQVTLAVTPAFIKAQPVFSTETKKAPLLNTQSLSSRRPISSSRVATSHNTPSFSSMPRIGSLPLSIRPTVLLPSSLQQRQQITDALTKHPQEILVTHSTISILPLAQQMQHLENMRTAQVPQNRPAQTSLSTKHTEVRITSQQSRSQPQGQAEPQQQPAEPQQTTTSHSETPRESAPQEEPKPRTQQSRAQPQKQAEPQQRPAEPQQTTTSHSETPRESAPQEEPKPRPQQSRSQPQKQAEPQQTATPRSEIPRESASQQRLSAEPGHLSRTVTKPSSNIRHSYQTEEPLPSRISEKLQSLDRVSKLEVQPKLTAHDWNTVEVRPSTSSQSYVSTPRRNRGPKIKPLESNLQLSPTINQSTSSPLGRPTAQALSALSKNDVRFNKRMSLSNFQPHRTSGSRFAITPRNITIPRTQDAATLREQRGGLTNRPLLYSFAANRFAPKYPVRNLKAGQVSLEKSLDREEHKRAPRRESHHFGALDVRPNDFYRKLKVPLSTIIPTLILAPNVGKLEKKTQIYEKKAMLSPEAALHRQRLIETLPTLTPGPFMYFKGKK